MRLHLSSLDTSTPLRGLPRVRSYFADLARAIGARWAWWAVPLAVATVTSRYVAISINVTESLPERVFVVLKQSTSFQRGDYLVFRHPGGGPYPAGAPFVKKVAGVAGDLVEVRGRDFYVNGQLIGRAKETSKSGFPLLLGPTGVIAPGAYFVYTPHPDSFDSRYALTGWIGGERIIGRAVPIL